LEILNNKYSAAIHECVSSNEPKILEMFLNHKRKPDVNLRNKYGATAVHYCAVNDNLECVEILLKNNARLCERCSYGFFPIHLAAHSCANKVLKRLVAEGN
jgi:ankyrin repeat protein